MLQFEKIFLQHSGHLVCSNLTPSSLVEVHWCILSYSRQSLVEQCVIMSVASLSLVSQDASSILLGKEFFFLEGVILSSFHVRGSNSYMEKTY